MAGQAVGEQSLDDQMLGGGYWCQANKEALALQDDVEWSTPHFKDKDTAQAISLGANFAI